MCRDFVAALDDFFAADASERELEDLDAHLVGCELCVSFTRSYMSTVRLARVALLGESSLPPDCLVSVISRAVCGPGAPID